MTGSLWVKSNFSFLEGASHPGELVSRAAELGLPWVALTDRDGVYGAVRAHVRLRELAEAEPEEPEESRESGKSGKLSKAATGEGRAAATRARGERTLPRLIHGAQVTVDDGTFVVLLCADLSGWQNLCRLLTQGRLRSDKGTSSVSWEEVADAAEGLFALWGGEGSALCGEARPDRATGLLREAYGDRLCALLARHRSPRDLPLEARTLGRARRYGLPAVAATEVLYHRPERRRLQDALTCVRHGVTLRGAGRLLRPNDGHALLSTEELGERYAGAPGALERAAEVAGRCGFSLSELRYRYPSERLPGGTTSAQWLRHLTWEGAQWRYDGRVPSRVGDQLERELSLIEELDYPGYFLTMWEIVEFCRQEGILCQGRGSAANSAVCYCLGITAVDPIKMDLLFERFISRERPDPPDIDLDIEHDRREEVIRHVYHRYGRSHAAMVANVVRYRPRSAVRDMGKALGLPEVALDRLAKLLPHYGGADIEEVLVAGGLDPAAPTHRHLMELALEVQGFPRHLSIHPGGFLLGHEPVHQLVPVENATMEGRTVIQWDKDDVEALGLFKVDLLGLGALNLVHRCFDLLREHRGLDLTLATLPAEDPATYDMVCEGDTVGVFQIESRAQMAMLPRLRPRRFYDLVVEVSIVRPGPIAGDMVHPYLRRRNGDEPVTYPHPCLEPVLGKTLGVPLFQEQVIKLAMVAADYTPGEADQLRRDMAAWRKHGSLDRHRKKLIERMVRKGIGPRFAERVFDQIQGFGEYGFPESHAASFALIVYATAWLKRHHPGAFACALLNAQPMGFYSPGTIVEDARRHGVEVRPADVRVSGWDCSLEPASGGELALRMGLRFIKGLGEDRGQRVALQARLRPFADLLDLVRRCRLDEHAALALAEAGALQGLGLGRREALWEVRRAVRAARDTLPLGAPGESMPLFAGLSDMEQITWDYRTQQHSTRGHPLLPLRDVLRSMGLPTARQVSALEDNTRVRYAGLVINRQQPYTAGGVVFMTLEDETGFVNLVLWKDVFAKNALVAKTEPLLGVTGKVQKESGVVHLVVASLWVPALERPPRGSPSRDFR